MKWQTAILVAGLTAAAVPAAEDDVNGELKQLEGNWEVVSIDAGGKRRVDAGKGAPEKAVIKGGKVTFFAQGKELPFFRDLRLDLDPKKKPKEMDLVRGGKESLPCIYELKGNELRIAMPFIPKKPKRGDQLSRPTSFDTKDKPVMVLIAKRIKK